LHQKNLVEILVHLRDDTQTPRDDDDCEDISGIVDTSRLKLKEQNGRAYALLVTSIAPDTDQAKLVFDIVQATERLDGYPYGNFKKAWLDLKEFLRPETLVSLSKMKMEYQRSKMKLGDSPAIFMGKMNDLRSKMRHQGKDIDDDEFIIDVLDRLPSARHKNQDPPYGMVKGFIERDIEEGTKTITPFVVQQKLTQRFEELKELEGDVKTDRQEIALNAEESGGRAHHGGKGRGSGGGRGRWNQSSGSGRTSGGGRSNSGGRSNNSGRLNGGRDSHGKKNVICHHCKKPGHYKAECFKWKALQEQGTPTAAATPTAMATAETYSVSLMAMTCDKNSDEESGSWSFRATNETTNQAAEEEELVQATTKWTKRCPQLTPSRRECRLIHLRLQVGLSQLIHQRLKVVSSQSIHP